MPMQQKTEPTQSEEINNTDNANANADDSVVSYYSRVFPCVKTPFLKNAEKRWQI
jgi:hypothetical protein